jgi:hypothetical protein
LKETPMFMVFHATTERKPLLVAASLALIMLGIGVGLSL